MYLENIGDKQIAKVKIANTGPGKARFIHVVFLVRSSATPTTKPAVDQPHPFPYLLCYLLQLFQNSMPWRLLPIPPAPVVFDQHVVDLAKVLGARQMFQNPLNSPGLTIRRSASSQSSRSWPSSRPRCSYSAYAIAATLVFSFSVKA